MLDKDPSAPFFDLEQGVEFKVSEPAQARILWGRSDAFYWILTLEGTAYFAESGRSQFLRRGWVLAKQGPLHRHLRLGEKDRSWRGICLSGSRAFARNRMAYVARQMGAIHKIPLNSNCLKLARKLGAEGGKDPWERRILGFSWFHEWWQEADKYNREILRFLETAPGESNPAHSIASLKSLADQLGYSPGYLSRILGKKWRKSPARSLRKARLEFAARQLKETSIQVGALANELGYLSECAFVRAFRVHYGKPPEKYRKAHGNL